MKNRWIAALLLLVLALALLAPAAAMAEPAAYTMTLGIKEKYQINVSSIPGAAGKDVIYATSNKKIATVSSTGLITPRRRGTVKIAVAYEGKALAICTITVLNGPRKVTLNAKTAVVNAGEKVQLTATLPKKSSSAITFESDNTAVATVNAAGEVTGVAPGTAVITARAYNNRKAKCSVTVLAGKAPTKVTLNVDKLSIQKKEKFTLEPAVGSGEEAAYFFASANKKIATVSADGVVTGKRKGTTQITVRTHNGKSATVTVVVKGKLKNLYGYLTNKPKTFVKYAKRLKMKKDTTGGDTSVMYYNSQAALIMGSNYCQVSLSPANNPTYCLEGIDTTMTAEQAAAKLVANGWALANSKIVDGNSVRAYTKEGDATHNIVISADGDDILSLDAIWNW